MRLYTYLTGEKGWNLHKGKYKEIGDEKGNLALMELKSLLSVIPKDFRKPEEGRGFIYELEFSENDPILDIGVPATYKNQRGEEFKALEVKAIYLLDKLKRNHWVVDSEYESNRNGEKKVMEFFDSQRQRETETQPGD